MSGLADPRFRIRCRVRVSISCGRLRDDGTLRKARKLRSRFSCVLQHAAPVGGTEGQGLGLRRGLDGSVCVCVCVSYIGGVSP